jgi:hypothetical protein
MSHAADEPRALFVSDGDTFVPTGYARGPWSPHSLHGGPVAALVVRALEALEAPRPARLARVTVELLRPVPLAPLEVHTEVVRPGAKVSTLDATVTGPDGAPLVLARAQRIRTAPVDFADGATDVVPELPAIAADTSAWPGGRLAFHSHATEHRYVHGEFGGIGPCTDWVRLVVPVVLGEEPTGWQRAAAIADFSNGISAVVPFDGASVFINPDLTVHLWREPVGEWICSEAVTRTSDSGIGLSETALWDRNGRVGRGLQSLLLDRS